MSFEYCNRCGMQMSQHTTGGCPMVIAQVPCMNCVHLAATITQLREAGGALVAKLDAVLPTLQGYAVMAHVHGARYNGPTFGEEWENLRRVLAMTLPLLEVRPPSV